MGYRFVEYEVSQLFRNPHLKPDGSNFKRWYKILRGNLKKCKILFTLEEHLEERPSPTASQEEDDKYHERRDAFIEVQVLLTHIMEPELVERFMDFDPYDTMEVLRYELLEKVKPIRYEYWDELLSTTMEENTCLEANLTRMLDAYEHLTEVWDDWMDDSFAKKWCCVRSRQVSKKSKPATFLKLIDCRSTSSCANSWRSTWNP